jgi:hypothetical protein
MSKSCNSSEVALVDFVTTATGQRRTLEDLESVISKAEFAFAFSGLALAKIRDEKLYREAGYKAFEKYCKDRWGFSRKRAYQLIDAASLAGFLSTNVDILPANESQIRPLVGRPLEEAAEIWKLVIEMACGAPVTQSLVKKAIKALLGEAPKPEKSVTELLEKILHSCHELSEHLGDNDLSGLDPNTKSRLSSASREMMQLAIKAGCWTRPEGSFGRSLEELLEAARAFRKPRKQTLVNHTATQT